MADTGQLEQVIASAESTGGTVGVAISSSSGWTFVHNADRRFRAASTVKIPIMIRIFRRIDAGELHLDDPFTMSTSDFSAGSGVLHEMHEGLQVTVADLLYLMMSISDNTATNVLIDMAGMDEVNALMRELGMGESVLGRKMQGHPAEGEQRENWAVPSEYASLIGKLLDQQVASPESCKAMAAILEKQQNPRRIGRYVPEDGFRWGSKTGSISGVVNDVGFITGTGGTVIVSVYCEDLPDMYTGEQVIGDIARAAMDLAEIAG
jgi:beta-lactamase class A